MGYDLNGKLKRLFSKRRILYRHVRMIYRFFVERQGLFIIICRCAADEISSAVAEISSRLSREIISPCGRENFCLTAEINEKRVWDYQTRN